MARLTCSRSGWGAVKDPETGERIPVNSEVSQEVAERLATKYDPISYEETDEPESDESESVEAPQQTDELESLTLDELKEKAREEGIADTVDLRSKDSILEALRE